MARSITNAMSSFVRPGQVTYDFSQSSETNVVTIILPANSTWTSGLHWHESHTEYLQVVQGAAQITLGNTTRTYRADDGAVQVPRTVRHEWKRAQEAGDELVVVHEWTDPSDGQKEIFFRNLSSVILHTPRLMTIQLFVIFHALDNYPVLISGTPAWFEWVTTHFALSVAAALGWPLGIKAVYEEYTRPALWTLWNKNQWRKSD